MMRNNATKDMEKSEPLHIPSRNIKQYNRFGKQTWLSYNLAYIHKGNENISLHKSSHMRVYKSIIHQKQTESNSPNINQLMIGKTKMVTQTYNGTVFSHKRST